MLPPPPLIPAGHPLAVKLSELERAQARMRDTTIASLQHKLAQIETFLKNDNRCVWICESWI